MSERRLTCAATCLHKGYCDLKNVAMFSTPSKCASETKMLYGMLFESVQQMLKSIFGDQFWINVCKSAGVDEEIEFATYNHYPSAMMLKIADACAQVRKGEGAHCLSERDVNHSRASTSAASCVYLDGTVIADPHAYSTANDFAELFGLSFVQYCHHYGFAEIMRSAGRHYRDFLHGIDNLHETIRFMFPKMRTPSFMVSDETTQGCILHYRSRRLGFENYVVGQLRGIGRRFYGLEMTIEILERNVDSKTNAVHVVYRLTFDNASYLLEVERLARKHEKSSQKLFSSIPDDLFFNLFPFSFVFRSDMKIVRCGNKLRYLFTEERPPGRQLSELFTLRRPRIAFTWNQIRENSLVIYELEVINGKRKQNRQDSLEKDTLCLLKGQMKFVEHWSAIIFLCSPVVGDIKDLENMQLFVGDLNNYDSTRDLVLSGWQRASNLEYLIDQQVNKSNMITEKTKQLHQWKDRSDELIYSMIPPTVAGRLKSGENPLDTCEFFEDATVMFAYLDQFEQICAESDALTCVRIISAMFEGFDKITEQHKNTYKVETLCDAVYMVTSGVPDRCPDHPKCIAELALELLEGIKCIKTPDDRELQLRIGAHCGSLVAGVIGYKALQYCIFGDTVNIASRMQSTGKAGMIHVSHAMQEKVMSSYSTVKRGTVLVKGKGEMVTYWLSRKLVSLEQILQDGSLDFIQSSLV